ncbi:THUMP domain-containing protein 1-like protein [Euroglyphus maynei]|uniref:THUMP domain-containing protein 1-like protein n=1 Tax=Euroglyphus maynei TaxID=6958 RepID=A0A1Y3B3I1_EURMA|nr:THUMP domain-containing protein 1-like protein [Euroglyphus maynei]
MDGNVKQQERRNRRDNKKKKRYYCHNKRKENGRVRVELENGHCGFLITCNQKEYQCLQESYNILNEISDQLYPNSALHPDPNDIEACIKAELEAEQKTNRRFLQVKTRCKNLLFIRIQDDQVDPQALSLALWKDLEQNRRQNCRYIQRIIPVIRTCRTDKIVTIFDELFERLASKSVCSFLVQCRIRNYSSMTERILQESIIEIVRERRPNWYVSLDRPDQFIQINVLCKAACISLLPDYNRYAKYNLIEFIKKHTPNGDDDDDDRKIGMPTSNKQSENVENKDVSIPQPTEDVRTTTCEQQS